MEYTIKFKDGTVKTLKRLSGANLMHANLMHANLMHANLRDADLRHANLYGADLSGANFRHANLYGADLMHANLMHANLYGANLRSAKNIPTKAISLTSITPEGDIIGWKKCRDNVIVKLLIPSNAKRSNATGRKCRAEFVKVLEVYNSNTGVSNHNLRVTYSSGMTVHCDSWTEDRWIECGGGIHFFITREEAESY